MRHQYKIWVLSALLGVAIAECLALITNLTGISFYKVVVIALLIMLLNKSGRV